MGALALSELPWRKVLGAAAVIVLHIAIVVILLRATIIRGMFRPASHETILFLPPLPKPEIRHVEPPARRIVPTFHLRDYRGFTLPQTNENSKAGSALGFQLFDCRIENISRLTEEQRAWCAKSSTAPKPNDSVDFADHTGRARDAMRWAREKQRKNQPLLLPCASSQSIFATLSTDTILCLAHGAISGFDVEAGPIYGERPEETHLPNNGDPPPVYADPDH
jgi:hypothetical protein